MLVFLISLVTGNVNFLGILALVGGVPIISKSDMPLEAVSVSVFGYLPYLCKKSQIFFIIINKK